MGLFSLAFLLLLSVSCASQGTLNQTDTVYRKDLLVQMDDWEFEGFGVLPRLDQYRLRLRSRKEPELIRISNCHRDLVFRDVDDKFSYEYIPNKTVETGSCILQISFLDSKGYHQFGAISFLQDETIPAYLSCNGERFPANGASVCQGKAGTLQVIEFYDPVEVRASHGCKLPTSEDGLVWEYSLKEGYCIFLFRSEHEEFHKLTTFGYSGFMKQ